MTQQSQVNRDSIQANFNPTSSPAHMAYATASQGSNNDNFQDSEDLMNDMLAYRAYSTKMVLI